MWKLSIGAKAYVLVKKKKNRHGAISKKIGLTKWGPVALSEDGNQMDKGFL